MRASTHENAHNLPEHYIEDLGYTAGFYDQGVMGLPPQPPSLDRGAVANRLPSPALVELTQSYQVGQWWCGPDEPERPLKAADHAMDATRYALHSERRLRESKASADVYLERMKAYWQGWHARKV